MAFIHGKNTVITINAKDLSQYTNSSELTRGADEHDVTVYGKNDHVVSGGLLKGNFSAGGVYDSTAVTGPRAALIPIIGQVVTVVIRPEGTGASKPQDSFSALINDYTQSSPVADMVKWSVKGTVSDAVTTTAQ